MKQITTLVSLIIITIAPILVACDPSIIGNKDKGYRVEIEMDSISNVDLIQIEDLLVKNGYQILFKERLLREYGVPRQDGEVYSAFERNLTNNKVVVVYIRYIRVEINNLVALPLITIENWFEGSVIPEIHSEINKVANLIISEVKMSGKERDLTIKHYGKGI